MGRIDISVIVPVYNVEKYLDECLASVLNQDFDKYEILCIDDASTDKSKEILSDYEKRYDKVRVITHLENRGLSAARNTGIENARGKYIWFVDADDAIMPNALAELFEKAEEFQTDIIYFEYSIMGDNKGKGENIERKGLSEIHTGLKYFCNSIENKKFQTSAWTKFIRKEFLTEKNICFYNGILHEDELFFFICSLRAERVLEINKIYYIYRLRKGSIMSMVNKKRAESMFVVIIQVIMLWASGNYTDDEDSAIGIFVERLIDIYRYYSCCGEKAKELSVGGNVEKKLYALLETEKKCKYLTLEDDQIAHIRESKEVVVFGSGKGAAEIIDLLSNRGIKVDAVVVSSSDRNPELFCGIRVVSIEDMLQTENYKTVVVGVTEKYRAEILEKLLELGYTDIVIPKSLL